jgi:hypothetical protein
MNLDVEVEFDLDLEVDGLFFVIACLVVLRGEW